jgi:hypothetical protein
MKIHTLQKSISGLIPIIYLSYSLQKYRYFLILLGNLCISLYVHRNGRDEKEDIEDYIDTGLIFLWVVKNTYELFLVIFINKNILYTIYFMFIAFIHVYNCYMFNNLRLKYNWRSSKNIEYHAKMHISGIIGTYVILSYIKL